MVRFLTIVAFCALNALVSARASKVTTRLNIVENRVNTLEMRMTLETTQRNEELVQALDTLSDLNQTVADLADYCVGQDVNASKVIREPEYVREISRGKSMAGTDMKLLAAFSNEKHWLRDRITEINDKIEEFERDMATAKDLEIKALIEKTVNEILTTDLKEQKADVFERIGKESKQWKAELEELRGETNRNFAEQQKRLSECEQEKSETEKQLSSMKHEFEKEIEALKGIINSNFQRLFECPDQWSRYDMFCYHFFDVAVEFRKARELCADAGANVVDVQDRKELDFVMGLVGGSNFWIGLTDSGKEGTWKWDRTNTVASFTNWRRGQPDSYSGRNQDCTIAGWELPMDQWNDQGCTHSHAFVCKKPRKF